MRLKRLDLYGYKSFAARHSVEFGEGITAIVGPNGSGKSNIADAVRWVMGEQRFRQLRAKTTEDLIFGGTRQRARMGVAEVILTLDNTTGWLPIDYAEVSVGRRAYRSGENEYIINGNVVRYRDVLDLLGVAGLARSTYTVIGQGMVDAALSLRPEERRELFEEAAGITPHLRKREQALRRIDETRRNLERVSDILSEIQPREPPAPSVRAGGGARPAASGPAGATTHPLWPPVAAATTRVVQRRGTDAHQTGSV
jgi:chromosome segregation protein